MIELLATVARGSQRARGWSERFTCILFNPHKISNETGALINPIIRMRNQGSGRQRLALSPTASGQQLWESEPRSLAPGFIPVNTYATWALATYYESLKTVFLKQKIT